MHLGVRDDLEVVYIEALRATATHPTNSRIGDRWPLHVTGTGLVLLAYADCDVQERALHGPLQRFTPLTVTDPQELRRQLDQVRRTGIAVARGQITLPDLVVAAPVHDQAGAVAAAVSVVVEAQGAQPKHLAAMLTEASAADHPAAGAGVGRLGAEGTAQPVAVDARAVSGSHAPARARLTSGRVGRPVVQAEPAQRVAPRDRVEHVRGQVHGTQGAAGRLLAGHRGEVRAHQQPIGAEQVDQVPQSRGGRRPASRSRTGGRTPAATGRRRV